MAVERICLLALALATTVASSACNRGHDRCDPSSVATVAAKSDRGGALAFGQQTGAMLGLLSSPRCTDDRFPDNWPASALRMLAREAKERIAPDKRAAYLSASPLVARYADEPTGGTPSAAQFEKLVAQLFDEVYWNTVDPTMQLRTIEAGSVEPLTSVREYQTLRAQLSVIHGDIKSAIERSR